MISIEVLTAIHPLADQINQACYRLATTEQSPVGALNSASFTPLIDTYEGDSGFIEAWQHTLTRHPVTGGTEPVTDDADGDEIVLLPQSLHSLSMDEAVSFVATGAMNARSHAQNVAKPVINSMLDKMETYIDHSTAIVEPFELVEVGLLDAWTNPIVRTALDNHPFRGRLSPVERAAIPRIPVPANVDSLVVTGSSNIDGVFAALLRETGMSATDVFNLIFNGRQDAGRLTHPVYLTRNESLLCYLFANVLLDNPVEGSGLELQTWETLLHKLVTAYADACNMILSIYETELKSRIVFHGISDDGRILYLNSPVYDQWLDAGGSPEILFGAHMNRKSSGDMNFQVMLDNAQVNQTAWSNYHNSQKRLQETERLRKVKDAMYSCVLSEIDDLDPRYYPPGMEKVKVIARAKDVLADIRPTDLNDVGAICMKYVCDVLFPHTNAYRFLSEISRKVEMGMDVEEAATEVTNEYITDWIISGLLIYKG
jgi:hypothetical protein